MPLYEGINKALLVVDDLHIEMTFNIYLYSQYQKLVISDIDGTITTEDLKGFVGPIVGVDVHHSRVVEFFHAVSSNGYIVIYLTARPMAFDGKTREYLFNYLFFSYHYCFYL